MCAECEHACVCARQPQIASPHSVWRNLGHGFISSTADWCSSRQLPGGSNICIWVGKAFSSGVQCVYYIWFDSFEDFIDEKVFFLFCFLLFVKLHVCMNAALNKVGVEYCKYAKCYQEHEFFVPCVTLPTNKKSVRIRDPTYFIMTNSDQSAGHMRTFF